MTIDHQSAQIKEPPKRLLPNVSVYIQAAAMMSELTVQDKQDLLRGIQLYQNHKFNRHSATKHYKTIWQDGEASVRYYAAQSEHPNAALFIVPSMINKSYIMDLLPDKSFIAWLCAQGTDVYLFDWGLPAKDEGMRSLDAVLHNKLLRAVQHVLPQKGAVPVHVLGYCMGGTLLAGLLQHCDDIFRSNIFLAAPWDFHAGDRTLATAIQSGTPAALQIIAAQGCLPATWIENVFAMAQVEKAIRKYIEFAKLPQDSDRAHLFVAVEDWLHDGMDLPGDIGNTCLVDWYQNNTTQSAEWMLSGQAVDLSKIAAPSLVVASENDRLVPSRSSLAMADLLPSCDVMQPPCGHIGMMTSKNAERALWKPLLNWVFAQ